MTTATISQHANRARAARRPAIDLLAERVARSLLSWTERRALRAGSGPATDALAGSERAARLRITREQDAARVWCASPFGHR